MTYCIVGNMLHASGTLDITEDAAKLANMSFNPSADVRIDQIKTLAAGFYTLCNAIQADENATDLAKREAAVAKTQMQTAAMFAVQAIARSFA